MKAEDVTIDILRASAIRRLSAIQDAQNASAQIAWGGTPDPVVVALMALTEATLALSAPPVTIPLYVTNNTMPAERIADANPEGEAW